MSLIAGPKRRKWLQLYVNGKSFSHRDTNTLTRHASIPCSHRSLISAAQSPTSVAASRTRMSQPNRRADKLISFTAVPHSVDSPSTLPTRLAETSLSTDFELPVPSSSRPAHHTPTPHTGLKESAVSTFKDARKRIDEIAEVI